MPVELVDQFVFNGEAFAGERADLADKPTVGKPTMVGLQLPELFEQEPQRLALFVDLAAIYHVHSLEK